MPYIKSADAASHTKDENTSAAKVTGHPGGDRRTTSCSNKSYLYTSALHHPTGKARAHSLTYLNLPMPCCTSWKCQFLRWGQHAIRRHGVPHPEYSASLHSRGTSIGYYKPFLTGNLPLAPSSVTIVTTLILQGAARPHGWDAAFTTTTCRPAVYCGMCCW